MNTPVTTQPTNRELAAAACHADDVLGQIVQRHQRLAEMARYASEAAPAGSVGAIQATAEAAVHNAMSQLAERLRRTLADARPSC